MEREGLLVEWTAVVFDPCTKKKKERKKEKAVEEEK